MPSVKGLAVAVTAVGLVPHVLSFSPSHHRPIGSPAPCLHNVAHFASPRSGPAAAASSTLLHSTTGGMGGGRRGGARDGASLAKQQEKRRIEGLEEKKSLSPDLSLIGAGSVEECSIIDDELSDELRKLGDLEPLERQLIRLEGLEPYVLVSVLTATASYSTINSEEFIKDGITDWTAAALLLASLGSTLCGLYSTTTFALSILYGKTALGMDREATYFYFLDQTAGKRFRGFQAFKASLLLFGVSILLLAVDKLPEQLRPLGFLASSGFLIFGAQEWNELTDAAQPIFTNVIPNQSEQSDQSPP